MDAPEISATADEYRGNRPRRKYTIAEKMAIVEETRERGGCVAAIAKGHGVATSLIFGWRRLLRKGLLTEAAEEPPLLPVKLSTPTVVPSRRSRRPSSVDTVLDRGSIEAEFAAGHRLRIQGVDGEILLSLVSTLSGR